MSALKAPAKGPVWFRHFAKSVEKRIEEIKPVSGIGAKVVDTGSGRMINVQPAGVSSPASTHPFKLVDASENMPKIRVMFGTVNGIQPSGMSPGDDPPYFVTPSGAGYVWLGITFEDDSGITSRWIDYGASVPGNPNPDDWEGSGNFYRQIGSYSVTDDGISLGQALSGSQEVNICDGSALWGLT